MGEMKKSSFFLKRLWTGALFLLFFSPVWAEKTAEVAEDILRVSILVKTPSFNLGATKNLTLFDLNKGEKKEISGRSIYLVKPGKGGMLIDGDTFGSLARVMAQEGDFIRVNGRRYRGTILIQQVNEEAITVINELGIDEYLCGILPREVSPSWPMETLKAQALASRSFALKNLGRHNSEGYNLCSKVHCQVYGGMEGEDERTNQAVNDTYNEVVLYKEDLANTVFFSNCGGKTESSINAWETSTATPYLKSVRCKYCKDFKHHEWGQFLTAEQITAALAKFSVELPIQSISVLSRGASGRVTTFKVKSLSDVVKIRASQFRMALGPDVIRSTFITNIRKKGSGFYFAGKGWGHGVGLCQEGALGMAERGASYRKIIKFYYPGTRIEKIEN